MAPAKPIDLDDLPHRPGIYVMRDAAGTVLYVGKAVDLAKRVRSYFTRGSQAVKTRTLVAKIAAVETIVVENEVEALLLESNLIKEHRPRYNVLLRDDKQYPYIRLSVEEPFPRIDVVRQVADDGARYYGPYVAGVSINDTVNLINNHFMVRKCCCVTSTAGWPRPRPRRSSRRRRACGTSFAGWRRSSRGRRSSIPGAATRMWWGWHRWGPPPPWRSW
jgi:excinuclease ABC subunit C